MPKVSVIIPVYNAGKFLAQTLTSVYLQSFQDLEIVIVDDGSTDDSLEVIDKVSREYSRAISIIRQRNEGGPAARNRGAQMARGELLAFLDADDLWYQEKLRLQVEAMQDNSHAVMVWANWDVIDKDGKILIKGHAGERLRNPDETPLTELLGMEARAVHLSTIVVRKDAFFKMGGFDPEVFPIEDYDFAFRIFQQGLCIFLDSPLVAYRNHSSGISKVGCLLHRGMEVLLKKLAKHYAHDREKSVLVQQLLADLYMHWGWDEVRAGQYHSGRRRLFKSLAYNPTKIRTYSRLARSFLPKGLARLISKQQ